MANVEKVVERSDRFTAHEDGKGPTRLIYAWSFAITLLLVASLTGCAVYTPKPLNSETTLLREIPHVIVNNREMPLPELSRREFNPDAGLDMIDVSILAVINNPELKVARDEQGIASAQLMSAGILPNPQLAAGFAIPTNSGPGLVNAFNLGLSYDIVPIITRSAAIAAANANSLKIDLTVLWQEWQVVQQARLLFIKITEQENVMAQLKVYRAVVADRYRRSSRALKEGLLTIDVVSSDLTALQDADARVADLVLQISKTRQDLNALLDLAPEVRLDLVGSGDMTEPDNATIEGYLKELPKRRPDLLALQAGYESQQQIFRKAVLAQFPALNIGITRARDTTDVYTTGIGITLSLPIFDRNQGNIAIEEATRLRLYDEYQARLNAAYSQARQVIENLELLRRHYKEASDVLPKLEIAVNRSKAALDAGNMNITTYSDLFVAFLNKRIEAITVEQNILEEKVILQTLLGEDLTVHITPTDIKLDKR